MIVLAGGCTIIKGGSYTDSEGTRRYRVPISSSMGARNLAQIISSYSRGAAPTRRNPVGEEVLYVIKGSGGCFIDGHRYSIAAGTAVAIPPGCVYQIENSPEGPLEAETLEIVSVISPPDRNSESGLPPVPQKPLDTSPFRTVRESDLKPIQTGDRTYKVLANRELGCANMTQFVGVIPPGRAPMHHHSYEEAVYIIEGVGRVHTDEGVADFGPDTSIYLPPGVSHALENTGPSDVRVLGVFHPAGSPADRYEKRK